jgi:hypothetical protein
VSGLAARRFRPLPEAKGGGAGKTDGMKVSYGIRWRAVGPEQAGRLSVGDDSLKLVDGYDLQDREIPFDEIRDIAVHGPGDGPGRLDVSLVTGETIECETSVARSIVDALAGKVPVVEEHELHPGLGL